MDTQHLAWVAVAPLVLLVVWVVVVFNRLVSLRNRLREAWSGIDVQLKRRHTLVPALVECVKGYRAHERGVFESVALQRTKAQEASGVKAAGEAEALLTRHLRTLFAVAEAYPELKADARFRQLSDNLVEIEDQIQYARRYYNGTVRDFNTMVESFPNMIPARLFAFRTAPFFEIENATERNAPQVSP